MDPRGVLVAPNGNILIADNFNTYIREMTPAGQVSFFSNGIFGYADGNIAVAEFKQPHYMAYGPDGNLYIADRNNHRIRIMTPDQNVKTIAGTGTAAFLDGDGTVAQFNEPTGIAVDKDGNIYISDKCNHALRKIVVE